MFAHLLNFQSLGNGLDLRNLLKSVLVTSGRLLGLTLLLKPNAVHEDLTSSLEEPPLRDTFTTKRPRMTISLLFIAELPFFSRAKVLSIFQTCGHGHV